MADYGAASGPEAQRLQIQRTVDNLQVAMPVRVLSFSGAGAPKVKVQPLTQMKITLGDEVSYKSLPPIENVPVVLPNAQTAGLALTLPIKAGDTGLLIIPDRGLDNFLRGQGDEAPPPFTGDPTVVAPRAHSLTDGIFVPGLCADSMTLAEYSEDNIELRDKERKSYISLGPEGIKITDGTCVMTMKEGRFKVETPGLATITSSNMDLGESSNELQYDLTSREGTFIDKDGVVLNSHVHFGVQPGSGNTDEPVK